MISFTLKCENGHSFDSWFKSSDAFEGLLAAGLVECAVCGSVSVDKAVMAPRVSTAEDRPQLNAPASGEEQAIIAMRDKIEAEADYVGSSFTKDARAMHAGDVPERPIYGEASLPEAKSMLEDGLKIAPLPFVPKAKAN